MVVFNDRKQSEWAPTTINKQKHQTYKNLLNKPPQKKNYKMKILCEKIVKKKVFIKNLYARRQ